MNFEHETHIFKAQIEQMNFLSKIPKFDPQFTHFLSKF